MLKKMMLLAIAVGALVAFAAPAAAQAQQVTNAEGEPATNITAFSNNTTTKTAAGTFACDTVDLTSTEVAVNEEATFTATGTGVADNIGGGDCDIAELGLPILKYTSIHWHIHFGGTPGQGSASFFFTYDITTEKGPIMCEFETPAEESAAITYTPGTDEIHVAGKVVGGPAESGCLTVGLLEGDFTVEADGLGPATIM